MLLKLTFIYDFIDAFTQNTFLRFKQLGIAIAIFLLFLVFRKIFTKYIFKITQRFTSKTKTTADDKIAEAFKKPLIHLFTVVGLYLGLVYLYQIENNPFRISKPFIDNFLSSVIIILSAWGVYNLTSEYSVLFDRMQSKFGIKVDNILFPFVSKCTRAIIIALAVIIVLEKWEYDIQGFITGLGLGGLAFALAAQDAAGNIIGGIIIILDKPFSIGDWIATSEVQGVVEDISFRSTKIRTFSQEIITVPNSKLANSSITNYAKRSKRRISFNLGVMYSTPKDKIEICINRIKEMLIKHPDVHKETIFVNFDKFNDSSLDIFIYFFTKTTIWEEYLKVKQDINFKIMDILEQEGVSIAFPSTSIYFETPIKKENNPNTLNENNKY